LELMDGRRSVREISEDSGLAEFEAAKATYGLVQAGLARPAGRVPVAASAGSVVPIEEHVRLGTAFYRAGMMDEAERELNRVLRLDRTHCGAQLRLGCLALRKGEHRTAARRLMRAIEVCGRT